MEIYISNSTASIMPYSILNSFKWNALFCKKTYMSMPEDMKRRNKFYQSLRTASSTIKGMETLQGIYKKNRRNGTLFGFSVSTEIKGLMGLTA